MGQRFKITEEEVKSIRKLYFTEQVVDNLNPTAPQNFPGRTQTQNQTQNQTSQNIDYLNPTAPQNFTKKDETQTTQNKDLSCVTNEMYNKQNHFVYNTGEGWLFFYKNGQVYLSDKKDIQTLQNTGWKWTKKGGWKCGNNNIEYYWYDSPNEKLYVPLPKKTKNLTSENCAETTDEILQITGKLAFYGCKTNAVTDIQNMLRINQDGIFGNGTKNAVIQYQKNRGLKPDGIVGKETLLNLQKTNPLQYA